MATIESPPNVNSPFSQLVVLLESGTILEVWDRLAIQERLVGNGVIKDPFFSELTPAISDAGSASGWRDAVGHFVEQSRTPKADSYGGEYYSASKKLLLPRQSLDYLTTVSLSGSSGLVTGVEKFG